MLSMSERFFPAQLCWYFVLFVRNPRPPPKKKNRNGITSLERAFQRSVDFSEAKSECEVKLATDKEDCEKRVQAASTNQGSQ